MDILTIWVSISCLLWLIMPPVYMDDLKFLNSVIIIWKTMIFFKKVIIAMKHFHLEVIFKREPKAMAKTKQPLTVCCIMTK